MSHSYFVNRHGNKLDIEEAVDEIETQEVHKAIVTQTPIAISKSRRSLLKLQISKKLILISTILVVLIVLGTWLVADATRRNYQQQTVAMKTSVKNINNKAFSTETTAKDAVKGITSQLTASTVCSGGESIINSVYTPAKQALDECIRTAATYTGLKSSLVTMNDLITYLDAQKVILSSALAGLSDGVFAEIPTNATTWQTSYDKLLKLSPPNQAVSAYNALIIRTKSVVDAWNELNSAQNTQNVPAFTAAETNLTKAYEGLRVSGDELNQIVSGVQKDIQTSVETLRS